MRKHSIKIQGHATSISLEDEFWQAIKALAKEEQRPLSALIAEIDKKRGSNNLSSAIRLYVLADLQGKAGVW